MGLGKLVDVLNLNFGFLKFVRLVFFKPIRRPFRVLIRSYQLEQSERVMSHHNLSMKEEALIVVFHSFQALKTIRNNLYLQVQCF